MIRHLVLLRFSADISEAEKERHYADLAALSGHIDGILDFRSARNVSVEDDVVHGFRDLFWFDFRDAAVRDAYLEDPKHKAIGARHVADLDGGKDGVVVCDLEL